MDNSIIIFKTEDEQIKVDVRFYDESVWLTIEQMAELFEREKSTISRHIKNVYADKEVLPEATVAKFATVQIEGDREVERNLDYYNLDVIISVGYRVKSLRGTQFRQWATKRLNEYIRKGFTMDDERLKNLSDTLEINAGETVATCEYCGTKQTLPKLDDEKKAVMCQRKVDEITARIQEERRQKDLEEEQKCLERERQAELDKEKKEKRKNLIRWLTVIIPLIVIVVISSVYYITNVVIPKARYNSAIELMEEQQYDEALILFENLGDYKDSEQLSKEAKYNKAVILKESKQYAKAIKIFKELGDYKDSASLQKSPYFDEETFNEILSLLGKTYEEMKKEYGELKDVKNGGPEGASVYFEHKKADFYVEYTGYGISYKTGKYIPQDDARVCAIHGDMESFVINSKRVVMSEFEKIFPFKLITPYVTLESGIISLADVESKDITIGFYCDCEGDWSVDSSGKNEDEIYYNTGFIKTNSPIIFTEWYVSDEYGPFAENVMQKAENRL